MRSYGGNEQPRRTLRSYGGEERLFNCHRLFLLREERRGEERRGSSIVIDFFCLMRRGEERRGEERRGEILRRLERRLEVFRDV